MSNGYFGDEDQYNDASPGNQPVNTPPIDVSKFVPIEQFEQVQSQLQELNNWKQQAAQVFGAPQLSPEQIQLEQSLGIVRNESRNQAEQVFNQKFEERLEKYAAQQFAMSKGFGGLPEAELHYAYHLSQLQKNPAIAPEVQKVGQLYNQGRMLDALQHADRLLASQQPNQPTNFSTGHNLGVSRPSVPYKYPSREDFRKIAYQNPAQYNKELADAALAELSGQPSNLYPI